MVNNNRTFKPQPDEVWYSVENLFLCERFTRETYEKKFGVQPPPFNPDLPIKRWFFTDFTYNAPTMEVLLWDSKLRAINVIRIPVQEIASVNIPGAYRYQPYINSQLTPAVLIGTDGKETPMNGSNLVDRNMLNQVLDEIIKDLDLSTNTFRVIDNEDPWPWVANWRSETKRSYMVISGIHENIDASVLLKERFKNGVGSPGKWVTVDTDGSKTLRFVPTPDYEPTTNHPEYGMPCRGLFTNERIEDGLFSALVVRTDKLEQGSGNKIGGLTKEQDATLSKIARDVALVREAIEKLLERI